MRLALSSAAARDLSLVELLDASERRGLAGIELVEGDSHSVGPECVHERVLEVGAEARKRGVEIAAFRTQRLERAAEPAMVRLAFGLDAPIVVPFDPITGDRALLEEAGERYDAIGARLLLEHHLGGDALPELLALIERIPGEGVGIAWDADPNVGHLGAAAAQILAEAGPHLRHIRLRGGGPETAQTEGQGIGSLIGRLTLAHYHHYLAVRPSTPRFHYAWKAWLGRARGGWGCGSKSADESLVNLA